MGYETKLYIVELNKFDMAEHEKNLNEKRNRSAKPSDNPNEPEVLNDTSSRLEIPEVPDELKKMTVELFEEPPEPEAVELEEEPQTPFEMDKSEVYCNIICMVELCKAGNGKFEELRCRKSKEMKDKEITPYFYGTDGNTRITEDEYGDKMVLMNPKEVLKALEEDNKEPYRRFDLAIAALKAAIPNFDKELMVLTYGW